MTFSRNDDPRASLSDLHVSETMAPMAPAERIENGNNHDGPSTALQEPQDQQQGEEVDDDDNDENGDDNHSGNRNGKASSLSESELMYSVESFGAIVAPVSITMILSALAVVLINDDETIAAGEAAYANTYQVFDLDETNSNAQNLGASVANTAVIVGVICAMTVVVVLLYKYRCLKIFYGYMVVVTALLLGYFTSNMFLVAIEIYSWRVSKLSFALVMYNYAVVGTLAIFYSRGIPRWVTQGYLITSSVCMAWQLSYFNEWMAWSLLVMLALYDLFAVLSPCGPLKALANLISKPGAPALPGLLYEAPLPDGISKPKKHQPEENETGEGATSSGEDGNDQETHTENGPSSNIDDHGPRSQTRKPHPTFDTSFSTTSAENGLDSPRRSDSLRFIKQGAAFQQNASQSTFPAINDDDHDDDDNNNSNNNMEVSITPAAASQFPIESSSSLPRHSASASSSRVAKSGTDGTMIRPRGDNDEERLISVPPDVDASNTGKVPLALAKMYKCAIIDDNGVLRKGRFASNWQRFYSADELRSEQVTFTARQLRSEVIAIFPPRGGKMVKSEEQKYDEGVAYTVYSRLGEQLRRFVVTAEGKVMQVVKKEKSQGEDGDSDDDTPGGNSIKLGLGDFVFYSLLVAKAAQYSYTAFLVCFLVILTGLAATLVILAIKGKALPALPISIFLGVIGFLWTRQFLQPWIREVLMVPFYV